MTGTDLAKNMQCLQETDVVFCKVTVNPRILLFSTAQCCEIHPNQGIDRNIGKDQFRSFINNLINFPILITSSTDIAGRPSPPAWQRFYDGVKRPEPSSEDDARHALNIKTLELPDG